MLSKIALVSILPVALTVVVVVGINKWVKGSVEEQTIDTRAKAEVQNLDLPTLQEAAMAEEFDVRKEIEAEIERLQGLNERFSEFVKEHKKMRKGKSEFELPEEGELIFLTIFRILKNFEERLSELEKELAKAD